MNGTKLVAIISDAASTGKLPLHLGSFQGSYRVLNSWNLPRNFLDLKKVLKIEVKSGKLVTSLEFFFFFFQSYNKCLISEFFPVVKSYSISPVLKTFNYRMRSFIILLCPHCTVVTFVVTVRLQCVMKKAWFLRFSRSLLITYLFSLCLEKKVYCFGKSLEKVVNFGSKNLYEPCLLKLLW